MSQTISSAGVNPTASDAVEVAHNLDVDPAQGLTAGESASRLTTHGPNRPGIMQLRRYAISLLAIIASSLVEVEELIKLVIRHRGDPTSSETPSHPLTVTPAIT
jgi:hypothetical protein